MSSNLHMYIRMLSGVLLSLPLYALALSDLESLNHEAVQGCYQAIRHKAALLHIFLLTHHHL